MKGAYISYNELTEYEVIISIAMSIFRNVPGIYSL